MKRRVSLPIEEGANSHRLQGLLLLHVQKVAHDELPRRFSFYYSVNHRLCHRRTVQGRVSFSDPLLLFLRKNLVGI